MRLQTSHNRFRVRRAFTLIEIMMVVGIIGLMAAMGVPSIVKAFQKEGMRKAVSDIQDVCFSAREQAIVGNKTMAVRFVPRERSFCVYDPAAPVDPTGPAGTAVNPHSGKTIASTLPEGVELAMLDIYRRDYVQSDEALIFFHSDGTSDEAVIVLIAKGGAESQKLTLEYATGLPVISATDQ